MRLFWLLFFLVATWSSDIFGQSVSMQLDSTRMSLSTPNQLKIILTEGQDPELLTTLDDVQLGISMWRFLDAGSWDPHGEGWIYRRTFAVYDTGFFAIAPMAIAMISVGRQDTLYTDAIPIEVYLEAEQEVTTDIKDIFREPWKWMDFLWVVYLIGGIAALIFLWRYRDRIFGRKAYQTPQESPSTPNAADQLALNALDALEQSQLWKSDLKEHYTRLSMICRQYLEDAYDLPAPESTTREILGMMNSIPHLAATQSDLGAVLHSADMVKYAKATLSEEKHQQGVFWARQWVVDTTAHRHQKEEEE